VVARIAIDVLRSARVRREEYVGPWLPEPLLDDPYEDPARAAELADSVSMAALLLLERLSPLERTVFVLREVFAFGFAEIATTFGDGDVARLRELFSADVLMVGDGGGKAPQREPIFGADRVAEVLAAFIGPLLRIGGAVEPHEVNGQPGAILRDRDGGVLNALALDIADGQIQTIRTVINPDKLAHVGRWPTPGRFTARRAAAPRAEPPAERVRAAFSLGSCAGAARSA
jgi:RNA polymerase sigma-70 factor (ECF subfamily)